MAGGEAGSSPVTAVFGVAIFLAFVLLATQTLVHLYASSLVASTAFDVARHAASEDGGGCAHVPVRARERLGRHADTARITCDDDGERIGVRIVAGSPARLFDRFGGDEGSIQRSATVRLERPR